MLHDAACCDIRVSYPIHLDSLWVREFLIGCNFTLQFLEIIEAYKHCPGAA